LLDGNRRNMPLLIAMTYRKGIIIMLIISTALRLPHSYWHICVQGFSGHLLGVMACHVRARMLSVSHVSTSTLHNITLSGLMVRIPDYRSRGPEFDPGATWEVVVLERGPLSLVRITDEQLRDKKLLRSTKPRLNAVGTRCSDHLTSLHPQKSVLELPAAAVVSRYTSFAD
jgi:hypothetical protein